MKNEPEPRHEVRFASPFASLPRNRRSRLSRPTVGVVFCQLIHRRHAGYLHRLSIGASAPVLGHADRLSHRAAAGWGSTLQGRLPLGRDRLGASAAVVFVPVLVNQPVLLSLAITAWAGFCLYVSLHDRKPRSYAFMLAGYTATTIAFSSVTSPDVVFETALARVEEIALGAGCATIVHSLLFPQHVSSALFKLVATSVANAGVWTAMR